MSRDEREAPHSQSEEPDEGLSLVERSVMSVTPGVEPGEDVAPPEEQLPASAVTRGLRWLSPRMLAAVLLAFAGAGIAGTAVTLVHPFRDWFMHLLMYVVIISFALLYVKAHVRGRTVLRYLMMALTVGLAGFFAWILGDLIPGQKVWFARSVIWRPDVDALVIPIGLLAGAAIGTLLHCVAVSRHVARGRV